MLPFVSLTISKLCGSFTVADLKPYTARCDSPTALHLQWGDDFKLTLCVITESLPGRTNSSFQSLEHTWLHLSCYRQHAVVYAQLVSVFDFLLDVAKGYDTISPVLLLEDGHCSGGPPPGLRPWWGWRVSVGERVRFRQHPVGWLGASRSHAGDNKRKYGNNAVSSMRP